MKENKINHFELLRDSFPVGYRLRIQSETGASISLINKVLRGELSDSKGIVVSAYNIANEEQLRRKNDARRLGILQKKLQEINAI